MNLKEYQAKASRTIDRDRCLRENLKEFALALCEEAGESASPLKKHLFHGHELNKEKLKEELGDVLWHMAAIAELNDMTLDEIAEFNIEKLENRYPEGFDKERSIKR